MMDDGWSTVVRWWISGSVDLWIALGYQLVEQVLELQQHVTLIIVFNFNLCNILCCLQHDAIAIAIGTAIAMWRCGCCVALVSFDGPKCLVPAAADDCQRKSDRRGRDRS